MILPGNSCYYLHQKLQGLFLRRSSEVVWQKYPTYPVSNFGCLDTCARTSIDSLPQNPPTSLHARPRHWSTCWMTSKKQPLAKCDWSTFWQGEWFGWRHFQVSPASRTLAKIGLIVYFLALIWVVSFHRPKITIKGLTWLEKINKMDLWKHFNWNSVNMLDIFICSNYKEDF